MPENPPGRPYRTREGLWPGPSGAPHWPADSVRRARVLELAAAPVAREDFMARRLNALIGLLKAAGGVAAPR